MIFSNPQWSSQTNSYKVIVHNYTNFLYKELRTKSSGELFYETVNILNSNFIKVLDNFAEAIHTEGKLWFASPIKPQIFIKKVKHIFEIPSKEFTYGSTVEFTWVPRNIQITTKSFEILWEIVKYENQDSVIPSNFIDISDELELQPRTIIIQQNDIIENAEIPFDNSEQDIHPISSRAILKQKVRKAKLKAAISTMKAERMAEKYFRRYGIQRDLDSDSDLSFDSDEEESEEE